MNAEKSVRQIAEEWNAKAKSEGMYLDQDPWSIPPRPGSLLDVPETRESKERVARLRARIAELNREKTAMVEPVPEGAKGKVQGIAVPGVLPTAADAPPADAPQH